MPGLLARTAWVASIFAVLLFCVSSQREALDRAFGAAPAHVFHGQSREAKDRAGTRLSIGLQDASLGYLAAFPLMFFGLVLLSRGRYDGLAGANVPNCRPQPLRSRMPLAAGIALATVTVGVAGLILILSKETHRDFQGALKHTHLVTRVPVDDGFAVEGLRVIAQSAQWVRQPRLVERSLQTRGSDSVADDPDRIYLEVGSKHRKRAPEYRTGEFRMVGSNGANWAPLADDFPEIVLGPARNAHHEADLRGAATSNAACLRVDRGNG